MATCGLPLYRLAKLGRVRIVFFPVLSASLDSPFNSQVHYHLHYKPQFSCLRNTNKQMKKIRPFYNMIIFLSKIRVRVQEIAVYISLSLMYAG